MTTGSAQTDREALLSIYRTTGGQSWTHQEGWADNADDLGRWFGVTISGEGRVVKLELQGKNTRGLQNEQKGEGNNICGPVPPELGRLDALRTLNLSGNKLHGPIPGELCQSDGLRHLDLSYNKLNGSIPPEVGRLLALETLHLCSNRLTGSIPPELGQLVALKTANFRSNRLTGSIPPELGGLVALENLTLRMNQLAGWLPPELGRLAALKTLDLGSNRLTYSIPSKLGSLVALENLDLRFNQLTGSIPPELGGLVTLASLDLSENKLSGSIPPELGGLAACERLDLGNNNLTGSIPAELGRVVALKRMDMSYNRLTGPIPPELGGLVALEGVDLSSNRLNGSMPSELGVLVALKTLYLFSNKLSGSIPPELGGLVASETLDLSDNKLTGTIPPELGELVALESLDLSSNGLNGPIPVDLGRLVVLKSLDISSNGLTGPFPPELGGLVALEGLDVSSNLLTGSIPAELGRLTTLKTLYLFSNKLTGLGKVEDALNLVQRLKKSTARGMENLRLESNPWIMPPEAVVEEGLPAVVEYLTDVRTAKEAGAGVKELKLLKVVLVGSSQAGKTSLMNSIVLSKGSPTRGTPEEVSTVGIELLRHRLRDIRVEFYDCAGQLDYAGMHQTFLSRRAVYLLVWDVHNFHGKHGNDLDQVITDDVMTWLYALHLRAPDSTVILVANKCDGSVDAFSATVQAVSERVGELLQDWQDSRGIHGQVPSRSKTLTLLPRVSLVSCADGLGLSDLIDRVAGQGGTSFSVPPAWDLALAVLDALRDNKAPLGVARKHLNLSSGSRDGADNVSNLFIPTKALTRQWQSILGKLDASGELRSEEQQAVLKNPDSALKGSLQISEFAGQVLRVDGGEGIFLDVELLSQVLNPIMDHKLRLRKLSTTREIQWRDDLLNTGVLRWAFARYLWRDIFIAHSSQASEGQLEEALFDVLVKLGVALPLGRTAVLASGGDPLSASREENGLRDMLVWRWLPLQLTEELQEYLESLLEKKQQDGAREVTLKWEFDRAGAPHGLVGRLMALCHVVGEAETGLCWRSGAVFKSARVAGGADRPYVVAIHYDGTKRVLSVRMFGQLESERVWVALRFIASVMVNISVEWPGMLWEGWLECADHVRDRVHLTTSSEARIGTPLLAETSNRCDCLWKHKEGVLGQTVARLGDVIDTRTGDPFRALRETDGISGAENLRETKRGVRTTNELSGGVVSTDDLREIEEIVSSENLPETEVIFSTENLRESEGVGSADRRWCAFYSEALTVCRPHAWKIATSLAGAASALFWAAIALAELENTIWKVFLGLVALIWIGAMAAALYACKHKCEELRSSGQEENVARDFAPFV